MKFNYELGTVFFAPGFKQCFMDKYLAELDAAPFYRDGGFYAALSDLGRIYSPDFAFTVENGSAEVEHGGMKASVPVLEQDGAALVDLKQLLHGQLGKSMLEDDEFIGFGNGPEVNLDRKTGIQNHIYNTLRGTKTRGDLYRMYWNDYFKRFIPYRLFVPYAYDPAVPSKLILGLHGGGGNPNRIFEISSDMFQFYADKYGYIVLSVDGALFSSSYGCVLPIAGARGAGLKTPEDRENPRGYTAEELEQYRECTKSVMRNLEIVRSEYNVDSGRIFIFGNSMGGIGTLYLTDRYPGMFRAAVPAGAMIDTGYFRGDGIGATPMLFVAGMEDFHGFDFLEGGCRVLQSRGRNLKFRAVGGGGHSNAWVMVLDEIFDFFNKNA